MKAYTYTTVWIHRETPPAACAQFPDSVLSMQPLYRSVFILQSLTLLGRPCCSQQQLLHSWGPELRQPEKVLWDLRCDPLALVGILSFLTHSNFFLHSLFLEDVHPFLQTVRNSRPWEGLLWCVQCNWEWEDFFVGRLSGMIACDLFFDLFLTYLHSILLIFVSHSPGADWAISRNFLLAGNVTFHSFFA